MINRELYMQKIRPFINQDVVKVLTGIRRCGKSVMLNLIRNELLQSGVAEKQMLSINFESRAVPYTQSLEQTFSIIQELAHSFAEKAKIYLFLDEIQELDGWEKMINSCLVDFAVDIYITGSNAKMLSGELATYLGGRYVEFKIYPFSFSEVIEILKQSGQYKSDSDAFRHYLIYGGMPFLYQADLEKNDAMQYLGDIYNSILLKDIAQRNKIRDIDLFKRVLLFFIANIGNSFSAANIVKYLKSEQRSISLETIYNFIEYSKSACLLHMVPREDIAGKRLLSFQEKIFIADHGFRESMLGNNEASINQVLENIVYLELLRRGYEITIGKNDSREVDFVCKRRDEKIYVQVAYLLASPETIEREFTAYDDIRDNYPKYVVTMDELDMSRNGIIHLNIRQFLLMPDI